MGPHSMLNNIAIVAGAGLVGAGVARAFRLPALVGYMAAGVALGPHTPGIVADADAVSAAANLGVVLLMFAVGVQFDLHELQAVRRIALVAGSVQIAGTILLGVGLGSLFGWSAYTGIFLGCALALSSTAVMIRLLEERGEMGSDHGAIMVGIAVLQDLSLIFMAALLPALAAMDKSGALSVAPLALALGKAALFVVAGIYLAMRAVPRLLDRVKRLGSRELFVLASVAVCLGAASAAEAAGLGLALGAFMAGLVISESEYAHEVFRQVRPLRDVFAAIFFVSIGMLLEPAYLMQNAGPVALTALAIIVGKLALTAVPIYLLGRRAKVALTVGAGLGHIGEFSFVLASLGVARGLVGRDVSSLILSAALVTIVLAPFTAGLADPLDRLIRRLRGARLTATTPERAGPARALVLGYGRVGRCVSEAMKAGGIAHLVVEADGEAVARCRAAGVPAVYGDASSTTVLALARPGEAEVALVALSEALTAEMAVDTLREMAPRLTIVVRVHRRVDVGRMVDAGADRVILAEMEAAVEMARQGFGRLGMGASDVDTAVAGLRQKLNEPDASLEPA